LPAGRAEQREPGRDAPRGRRDEQKFGQIIGNCSQSPEKNNLASPPEWVNKCGFEKEGCGKVKQISVFVLGFAAACASAAAPAQDLTAGKTPAQLFHSDCAECHRSPGGITRTRDLRALADFLREHYTTKSETASALAAYVASFAVTGPAARNRGAGVAPPADGESPQAGRRNRGHRDATAADVRSNPSAPEDTAARRRRSGVSGDGESRRAHNDGDAPRPPGGIPATPASAKSGDGEPRDANAPPSRLRSRVSAGHSAESANAESRKPAAPKARKRRNRIEDAEPAAPDAPAQTKTNADVPAAPGTPQAPAAAASPPAQQ
jgi:hypothetical protein